MAIFRIPMLMALAGLAGCGGESKCLCAAATNSLILTASSDAGVVQATPDGLSVAFGPLPVGQSATRSLIFANDRNTGQTLTVLSVSAPSDPELTFVLPLGPVTQTVTAEATFSPTSVGQTSGVVTIQTDSPQTPTLVVTLVGDGE